MMFQKVIWIINGNKYCVIIKYNIIIRIVKIKYYIVFLFNLISMYLYIFKYDKYFMKED